MDKIYALGIWVNTTGSEDMSIIQSVLIAVIGIVVVLAELALLACFIILLSKILRLFTKKNDAPAPANNVGPVATAPAGTPLPKGQSAGSLDLVNVDEPTAAVIMAIVSNKSGIPLNRLAFKSIKLMEDK